MASLSIIRGGKYRGHLYMFTSYTIIYWHFSHFALYMVGLIVEFMTWHDTLACLCQV